MRSLGGRAAEPTLTVQPDPLAGTRYRVIRLLGTGGMGQVLLAEDREAGRRVAVKLIRQRLAKYPDLVKRFREEARAASQTGHPHIVEVFDFGVAADGRPYMVMELLDGESLFDLLCREKLLPQARAVGIGIQVADGLGAAHVRGVIHRDLKPANIHLCSRRSDGHEDFVKILDFGLAKLLDQPALPDVPPKVYGTPEYMAPESARPDQPPDARADVYSLGVLLYEMVTGSPPFRDEDAARVVEAHLTEMPAPPSERVPEAGVDVALEQVIMICLRKRPENRYHSMEALARALGRVQGALRRIQK